MRIFLVTTRGERVARSTSKVSRQRLVIFAEVKMAKSTITVTVNVRWWFEWIYLPCLIGVCNVARIMNFEIEPDLNKLQKWLKWGVKVQPEKKRI